MKKSAQITVRLSQELRSKLENEALDQGIKLSKLINYKLLHSTAIEPSLIIGNNKFTFNQLRESRIEFDYA
jgi:hypothetical protein